MLHRVGKWQGTKIMKCSRKKKKSLEQGNLYNKVQDENQRHFPVILHREL